MSELIEIEEDVIVPQIEVKQGVNIKEFVKIANEYINRDYRVKLKNKWKEIQKQLKQIPDAPSGNIDYYFPENEEWTTKECEEKKKRLFCISLCFKHDAYLKLWKWQDKRYDSGYYQIYINHLLIKSAEIIYNNLDDAMLYFYNKMKI